MYKVGIKFESMGKENDNLKVILIAVLCSYE